MIPLHAFLQILIPHSRFSFDRKYRIANSCFFTDMGITKFENFMFWGYRYHIPDVRKMLDGSSGFVDTRRFPTNKFCDVREFEMFQNHVFEMVRMFSQTVWNILVGYRIRKHWFGESWARPEIRKP